MAKVSRNGASLREKLRDRFSRIRSRSPKPKDTSPVTPSAKSTGTASNEAVSNALLQLNVRDANAQSSTASQTANRNTVNSHGAVHIGQQGSSSPQKPAQVALDIWSSAFAEALDSIDGETDVSEFRGKTVEQIFRELESLHEGTTQELIFWSGVKRLRALEVLDTIRVVLDFTSPMTAFEPIAMTVVGIARGVTTIAISIAGADPDFTKRMSEMLEQISYIDECDTLGQKTNGKAIHKALVSVYRKVLEFSVIAFKILTRSEAKRIAKMIVETDRLPQIIAEFLQRAELLHKVVQNATLEVIQDIQKMLYERENMCRRRSTTGDEDSVAQWLDSGRLLQQEQYHTQLRDGLASEACKSFFQESAFLTWYIATDSRQMILVGDMGCGKSMLIASLIQELKERSKLQIPQSKICFYYCREGETRQITQILCTMLLSLLEQLPGLKRGFYEWYKQCQSSGDGAPAADATKLQEFLLRILNSLDRPLFLIIDGLDECTTETRKKLLILLNLLLKQKSHLKIALSSRPDQGTLNHLADAAEIFIAPDLARDRIIVDHMIKLQLGDLADNVKLLVTNGISQGAEGSAIWIKMIIDLIETRKVMALAPMKRFLTHLPLPGSLSSLYDSLLSRYTEEDVENLELTHNALRILAAAYRPLSILELSWAVCSASAEPEVTSTSDPADLVDAQRLMSLLRPFLSMFKTDDMNLRQLRLVHQSVKKYVEERLCPPQTEPAVQQNKSCGDASSARLNLFVLDLCIKYLMMDEVESIVLFSDTQIAISELPQEMDLFSDQTGPIEYDPYVTWDEWEETFTRYDPTERGFGEFFVYASSHWLTHLGVAEVGNLPPLQKIEQLCKLGSLRFDTWAQQNVRPNCTVQARWEFDSRFYDALSITSLYGSEAMLRCLLSEADLRTHAYLPDSVERAVKLILRWGDPSRVQMLNAVNSL